MLLETTDARDERPDLQGRGGECPESNSGQGGEDLDVVLARTRRPSLTDDPAGVVRDVRSLPVDDEHARSPRGTNGD
jgi:hypothetical protein